MFWLNGHVGDEGSLVINLGACRSPSENVVLASIPGHLAPWRRCNLTDSPVFPALLTDFPLQDHEIHTPRKTLIHILLCVSLSWSNAEIHTQVCCY